MCYADLWRDTGPMAICLASLKSKGIKIDE